MEPHPLWEYPCKPLSNVHQLFSLEFSKKIDGSNSIQNKIMIPITNIGILNGIAIWHDLEIDSDLDIKCGLVDDPKVGQNLLWNKNYKQAVQILDRKYEINEANKDKFKIVCIDEFDHTLGKFKIEFKVVKTDD